MKFPWSPKKEIPILSPRDGYDLWASSYGDESNPIKNLSNTSIANLLPDLKNKSVLDIGCGTGYFCQIAHSRGASRITGLDLSPRMIERAKINCPFAEIRCMDISKDPIAETFDVAILGLVLGHIETIGPVLFNIAASLNPGGTIILSDFHPFQTLHHAKRTFKDASGNVFEVQHYLHPIKNIIGNLLENKIMLEKLDEPRWENRPVIYALRAIKQQ